jgi:hypothetical protein
MDVRRELKDCVHTDEGKGLMLLNALVRCRIRQAVVLVFLSVGLVPVAGAQYPKTITLTVTKITRVQKETPACDNCATITTVEAHTATANVVLVCESNLYPAGWMIRRIGRRPQGMSCIQ